MEDTFDLLDGLWVALPALWLAGLAAFLRDWRRPSAAGPEQARCGLPRQPLTPPPAIAWLRGAAHPDWIKPIWLQRRRPAM